jgi:Flp pilus assembly protein TadD
MQQSQLTIQQALSHGRQLLQAGRTREAETLYSQILRQVPNSGEALHCMGIIAHQQGQSERALELIRKSVELDPNVATAQQNLGDLLLTAGQLEAAEKALRRALELDANFGIAAMKLGMVLEQQNKLTEAEEQYRKSIALIPNYPLAHCNLGDALVKQNRAQEAILCYNRAISLDPNLAEAYSNRAHALDSLNLADEAAADYMRAVQLKPTLVNALQALGVYHYERDRSEEATEYFRRALAVDPNSSAVHHSLSLAYMRLGRYEDACRECRQVIQMKPDSVDAYGNLGLALRDLGRYDESLEAYEQAMRVDPECQTVNANRALILLVRGQFEEGLREYQKRWKIPEFSVYGRDYNAPRWEGDADLDGKTILLWHEQGMGDTIHFVRYAKILAQRGAARVIIEVQKPLVNLLRRVEGVSQVITRDNPLPEGIDFHAAFLSLPGALGTTLDSIPADVPYLRAEEAMMETWRDRLSQAGVQSGEFKVGIVWRGTPGHRLDRDRSVTLQQFEPIARAGGARLVSLQMNDTPSSPGLSIGTPAEVRPFPLVDLTSQITDFTDTAALLANLDLLISVDTAVVHLAGAMARPVWNLLPYVPDWRWLLDRSDTPWYPTMRLLRQKSRGDWRTVFDQAAAELKRTIDSTSR